MAISILVVCTGNICRSPTGEGVLRALVQRRGLADHVRIASAGTHDYHVGEAPDPRSMKHAQRRGYDLSSLRACQVAKRDFEEFDYILAMDRGHLRILRAMAPAAAKAKLGLFLDASARWKGEDVPDPYYGGPEGFEQVLDMAEEAAARWLDRIEAGIDPSARMKNIMALLVCALVVACGAPAVRDVAAISPSDLAAALQSVSASDLLRHIEVLSSDDFEGRAPGTRGEEVTIAYLEREFKALGLAPGNTDGTFLQNVPLVEYLSKPALVVKRGARSVELQAPRDFIAWSPRQKAEVVISDSELVFVGYGVIAPEYGWDDYKGLDMRGKTLVMLVNDPQVPDPADPSRLDDRMFRGRAMTYYGRWTYKYEIAEQVGAAAALIVHETIPASYPYSVVVNSMGGANYELAGSSAGYPAAAGWIPVDQARELFAASGRDFEAMKEEALRKEFKPVSLGASATFRIRNTWKQIASHNVVARIEGSDPVLKDEVVVYTAHWDHFGWDPKLPGPKANQVYHGARDNAGGVASMLAVAKAFKALPRAPKRSIVFIATTAEERSLLGAAHYVNQPIYPLRRTLAVINSDGLNAWGRTSDAVIVGHGHSTLDEIITEVAATQGRVTTPDPRPETGGFFRGDQLPFIRAGVPSAYFGGGRDFIGKPPGFGEQKRSEYVANRYHRVADVVEPTWDLAGAVADVLLDFQVGLRVAEGKTYPQWGPDSEFKAKRDEMLR